MLHVFGHPVATCDVLGVVGSNLAIFKLEPTTPQHATTHRNRVAKHMQNFAPNNVVIGCIGMLQSFGRGFNNYKIRINSKAHNLDIFCFPG